MPIEALQYEFKYDKEGNKDASYSLVHGCLLKAAYIILKQKDTEKLNCFFNSIADDISLIVAMDENNKFFDIRSHTVGIDESLFRFNKFDCNIKDGYKIMEQSLDEGNCVIVQTITELLEFNNKYDPNCNIDNYKPSHGFLILHHDEDYYYYFEEDFHLNKKNFIPYEYNKEVGKISKIKLRLVFKKMLYFRTFEFFEKPPNIYEEKVNKILKNYIAKYEHHSFKHSIKNKELFCFSGREAILKLKEICTMEYLELDKPSKAYQFRKAGYVIVWQIGVMNRKRDILKKYFERIDTENSAKSDTIVKLVDLFGITRELWAKFRIIIQKHDISGKNNLDKTDIKYLDDILEKEDELYDCLKNYIGCVF